MGLGARSGAGVRIREGLALDLRRALELHLAVQSLEELGGQAEVFEGLCGGVGGVIHHLLLHHRLFLLVEYLRLERQVGLVGLLRVGRLGDANLAERIRRGVDVRGGFGGRLGGLAWRGEPRRPPPRRARRLARAAASSDDMAVAEVRVRGVRDRRRSFVPAAAARRLRARVCGAGVPTQWANSLVASGFLIG